MLPGTSPCPCAIVGMHVAVQVATPLCLTMHVAMRAPIPHASLPVCQVCCHVCLPDAHAYCHAHCKFHAHESCILQCTSRCRCHDHVSGQVCCNDGWHAHAILCHGRFVDVAMYVAMRACICTYVCAVCQRVATWFVGHLVTCCGIHGGNVVHQHRVLTSQGRLSKRGQGLDRCLDILPASSKGCSSGLRCRYLA